MHARIDEVSIKDLGRKEEPNEKMVTLVKAKAKGEEGEKRTGDWRGEGKERKERGTSKKTKSVKRERWITFSSRK